MVRRDAGASGAAFPRRAWEHKRNPPGAAWFLRFSHLPGVAGRDFPVPPVTCGIPAAPLTGYSLNAPMLGAA